MRGTITMRAQCFAILALVAAPALGQDAPSDVVDEVIVRGRPPPQLRVEIERVEDAVYERFNALNSNDDFDIQCWTDAPTGSRMPVRACLPQFALTAERRIGQDIVRSLQPATAGYGVNAGLHLMRMDQKGAALLAEMQRLARQDEELLRSLVRLAELKEVLGDRVGKRR
jgi:hypothetical protein